MYINKSCHTMRMHFSRVYGQKPFGHGTLPGYYGNICRIVRGVAPIAYVLFINPSFDGVFFTLSFDRGRGVDSIHHLFTCENNRSS